MPWPPWSPRALPRPRGGTESVSPRRTENRNTISGSDAPQNPPASFNMNALGNAHILRTESLTAVCLLIIAACALGFMMFILKAILIPFAIAVFLMYLLQPMVNYLCKPPRRWWDKCVKRRGEVCCEGSFWVTKSRTYNSRSVDERPTLDLEHTHDGRGCFSRPAMPRWLAVMLTIFFVLTALGAIGAISYCSILKLEESLVRYERGAERVASVIDRWLRKYNWTLQKNFLPYLVHTVRDHVPRALELMTSSFRYFFVSLVFLVYLLMSPVKPTRSSSVWDVIDLNIRRYILLKTMVSAMVAGVVVVMLWLLGVQMAYFFGLATFVLNFVPTLGPLIATALPMPLAICNPDLPHVYKVLAFLGPTTFQVIIGNLVEPGIFEESFKLSPVVVLLSLAFWGSLWGIPGMILAVPLVVVARIMCDNHDHPYTKTFVRVLAGNVLDSRLEKPEMTGWNSGVSGNAVDQSWGNDRVDEALSAAEAGAGRTCSPTLRSALAPARLNGGPRQYGTLVI